MTQGLNAPAGRLVSAWSELQKALTSVERLNDVLEVAPEQAADARATAGPCCAGCAGTSGSTTSRSATIRGRQERAPEHRAWRSSAGPAHRPGRAQRLGQVHPDQAGARLLSALVRGDLGRRVPIWRPLAAVLATADRRGAAGVVPVPRHGPRQHRAGEARRLGAGGGVEAATRAAAHDFIDQPAARLRHRARRARHQPERRTAAAGGDRARRAAGPADVDPGRGHVRARQRSGAPVPAVAREACSPTGPSS